ncbi:MAG: NAD(P)/FAD-dependent oxidoreductase [Hyphomonadaceae bacterium]|jgi:uncharacterized flavoprotein (TIGR03862 family)
MIEPIVEAPPLPVIIIGAGPAGLFAAELLAKAGHKVSVFDGMASVGRKFLLAGRGGLNLTHSEALAEFKPRYGASQDWAETWLDAFTPDGLRTWAEGLGQALFVGSSGRVFPRSLKASPLLRAWLRRLQDLGVTITTGARWTGFSDAGAAQFSLLDGSTSEQVGAATLLALGGASWPKLGADGAWADVLGKLGVGITPLEASNVGVHAAWTDTLKAGFGGAIIKNAEVLLGDARSRGDLVITHTGLEGGPIYALSPVLRAALKTGSCQIQIDLRPDLETEALAQRLVKAKAGQSISTALKSHLKLAPPAIALMREATGNKLPTTAMGLARLIKSVPIELTGLAGLERAISTAGGINQDAVDAHLMLNARPGVFVAGEMLNWDAPTGGYLLQACFSSAQHAAKGIDAWVLPAAD